MSFPSGWNQLWSASQIVYNSKCLMLWKCFFPRFGLFLIFFITRSLVNALIFYNRRLVFLKLFTEFIFKGFLDKRNTECNNNVWLWPPSNHLPSLRSSKNSTSVHKWIRYFFLNFGRRFALLSCIRFEKSINQKCPSTKEEIKIRNCCAYWPKLRNNTLHHFSLIQILRILSSSCIVVEWQSLINVVLYEKKKRQFIQRWAPPLQGTSSKKPLYHRDVSAKSFDRIRFTKRKLLVV